MSLDAQQKIQRVSSISVESDLQAQQWLKAQHNRVRLTFSAVGDCLSAFSQWLRIWPSVHLWLSNEDICSQSMYQLADTQGLIGENHALKSFMSVIKVLCKHCKRVCC